MSNSEIRFDVTTPERLDRALRHAAARMNPKSTWADTLFTISNPDTEIDGGAKKRALRGWIKTGQSYSTLQVTLKFGGTDGVEVKGAWSPGVRKLATEGPTYLTWDTGSSVELNGLKALRASDGIWVGGYAFGKNTLVLVIYRLEA